MQSPWPQVLPVPPKGCSGQHGTLLAHALTVLSIALLPCNCWFSVEIWWYHCRGVSVYLWSLRAQLLSSFQRLAEDGAAKAGIQKYNLCCLSKFFPTTPQHIRDGILVVTTHMPCCLVFNPVRRFQVVCEAVDSAGWLRWLERSHQAWVRPSWPIQVFSEKDPMKYASRIIITIIILSHPRSRISVQSPENRILARGVFCQTEISWKFTWIILNPNSLAQSEISADIPGKNVRFPSLGSIFQEFLSSWLCHYVMIILSSIYTYGRYTVFLPYVRLETQLLLVSPSFWCLLTMVWQTDPMPGFCMEGIHCCLKATLVSGSLATLVKIQKPLWFWVRLIFSRGLGEVDSNFLFWGSSS